MRSAWRDLDLAGGGLQEANRELARTLRPRRLAYLLWLFFPLGAHRFYLAEPVGGLVYVAASAMLAALHALGWTWAAVAPAALLVSLAAFDLWWIDRRVTALNKRLRMQAYLRPVPGAPPGFKGRLTDAGDPPASRPASFTEQERLLAEIERAKRDRA
jgi:TM2 domain-containing membrane protein YozV